MISIFTSLALTWVRPVGTKSLLFSKDFYVWLRWWWYSYLILYLLIMTFVVWSHRNHDNVDRHGASSVNDYLIRGEPINKLTLALLPHPLHEKHFVQYQFLALFSIATSASTGSFCRERIFWLFWLCVHTVAGGDTSLIFTLGQVFFIRKGKTKLLTKYPRKGSQRQLKSKLKETGTFTNGNKKRVKKIIMPREIYLGWFWQTLAASFLE